MTQKLYLVFGGELVDTQVDEFRDPQKLDIVGIFSSYSEARSAWQAASHRNIDNAFARYMIVHLHDLSPAGLDSAS